MRSPAAVIWISGLGAQGVNEDVTAIARRVAFACDRRDVAEATFALRTDITPEQVDDKLTVPRATILRTDASGTRPVLDFYELPTAQTLIGDRAARGLLSQVWFAARAIARVVPKAFKTRWRFLAKTRRERRQLAYAWTWMVLMIGGLAVLLGLLAATFTASDFPTWLKWAQVPVLFVGGLSIWKSAVAKRFASAGLVGYSVVDYLDRGEDKGSQLRGELAALLEHLAELRQPHASVDVVAYSFGSIVAIDALFPYVQEPPPRLATITRLITIACPFDFVRSYWPGYFSKRFSRAGAPGDWVNIYAPSDVLASNFRNDSDVDTAVKHVETRDGQPPTPVPTNVPYFIDGREEPVSLKDAVLLKGLRFHAAYWSSRVASEEGVFDRVISHLGKTGR